MAWSVLTTEVFNGWFDQQTFEVQADILAVLQLLQERGPQLGRPKADTLKGSRFTNLKELRLSDQGSPIRLFFAFDTARQAIILCGGDKTGSPKFQKQFYRHMIELAESLLEAHEAELKKERPGGTP